MNEALEIMLKQYNCQSQNDYKNALKEIIQELALLGLWRAKFFEKAAFYGGTALRIIYGLDRFSEDLDFSLLAPDKDFQLAEYLHAMHAELNSFGFSVAVDEKVKTNSTAIQSAFIKAGTKEHLLRIKAPTSMTQQINKFEMLTIKVEIDIDPPPKFATEAKMILLPVPYMINTYQLPDLFAGKLHAILYRPWKNRVKGRDWYDLIWYISRNIPVGLQHLQARLQQSQHWSNQNTITRDHLLQLLGEKIAHVDFEQAKMDVMPFINNTQQLEIWSNDFFKTLVQRISVV